MHLVSQVVFNYEIHHKIGTHMNEFSTITELKDVIDKTFSDKTLRVVVERAVQIIDTDNIVYPRVRCLQSQQYKSIVVGQEQFTFYVVDKIMYPNDVRKILNEKYGSTLDFDEKNLDKKQPICDFHVSERTQYGLRNPKTGAPTQYTLRSVHCCTAGKDGILVDRDLNQIWPVATNKPPKELVDLLARNKEQVYEG